MDRLVVAGQDLVVTVAGVKERVPEAPWVSFPSN